MSNLRDAIKANFVCIANRLTRPEVLRIARHMYGVQVLLTQEFEEIQASRTSTESAFNLLHFILKKGERASEIFLATLKSPDACAQDLAYIVEKNLQERSTDKMAIQCQDKSEPPTEQFRSQDDPMLKLVGKVIGEQREYVENILDKRIKPMERIIEDIDKESGNILPAEVRIEIQSRVAELRKEWNNILEDLSRKDAVAANAGTYAEKVEDKGNFARLSAPEVDACATDLHPSEQGSPEIPRDLHPPSAADSKVTDVNDIPASEVSKLLEVMSSGLQRIEDEIGSFSYDFGKNMELTARIDDPKTTDGTLLAAKLEEFLKQHISERFVKVVIKQGPVAVRFCCGGIGSAVRVAHAEQTLGLYLQYGTDRAVYWLSCAHGLNMALLGQDCHPDRPLGMEFSAAMHRNNEPQVKANIHRGHIGEFLVDLPTPYMYLNYNPCVLDNGVKLTHSIDIMIGTTPLTSWHLNNQRSISSKFVSPVDSQCCSPACILQGHSERCTLNSIIRISDFLLPPPVNGCQSFYAYELVGTTVQCRVKGNPKLVKGKVEGVFNKSLMRITNANNLCIAQNVVKIRPIGESRPELGHSGSVWLSNSETGYAAVAMTCAILTEDNNTEYWIASLLCASLLALSMEYPCKFPDYKNFRMLSLV